ncbi:hypothetical protein DENSPDRAFT_886971 [Dentipellis sp. KUC8613]|nr:hypothetical protein DENSPDRAFT_886971 [Dentipellis sp. KUC8613]
MPPTHFSHSHSGPGRQFCPRAPPFYARKPAFASRVTAAPAAPPRLAVVVSCHAVAWRDALSTPHPALFAPRTTLCHAHVAPHPSVSCPTPPSARPVPPSSHCTAPSQTHRAVVAPHSAVPRSARPVPPSARHTGRLRVPWGRLAPHPFPPSHTPPRRIRTPPCCFCANILHGLSLPHVP